MVSERRVRTQLLSWHNVGMEMGSSLSLSLSQILSVKLSLSLSLNTLSQTLSQTQTLFLSLKLSFSNSISLHLSTDLILLSHPSLPVPSAGTTGPADIPRTPPPTRPARTHRAPAARPNASASRRAMRRTRRHIRGVRIEMKPTSGVYSSSLCGWCETCMSSLTEVHTHTESLSDSL